MSAIVDGLGMRPVAWTRSSQSDSSNRSPDDAGSVESLALDSGQQLRLRQGYLPHTSNAFLYRWEYLKMIFDYHLWQKEAVAIFASTLSSLYATILVCVYVAFAFTELVTYPRFKEYLEINGFFVYLFIMSDIYLAFIIYQVLVAGMDGNGKPRVIENDKSHGSLTVRIGAIIFGLGTFIYLLLQLIKFFEMESTSPCYHATKGINAFLMIIFVILQAFIIFTYPRLNLLRSQLINRYGTMHVVATNIILWIRTLIKESLEEITEIEEEHTRESELHENETERHEMMGHVHSSCNVFLDAIKMSDDSEHVECDAYQTDILGHTIEKTTPYLYPFIIEFALIGASVIYVMSNHIGKRPRESDIAPNVVHKPNPTTFLRKKDFTHSFKGIVAGLLIITIALINLTLFFGLDVHEHTEDVAEYLSKISNTIINFLGITGLIIGLAEIQQLDFRDSHALAHGQQEMDLDMKLLRFTSVFAFMYMIFTIITGAFNTNVANFPDELHVVNGVVSITQICLQITFISNLKHKILPADKEFSKPGRQITVFLFLYNLAQWLVFTFEIQKVRASLVEAAFYGFMPWIVIQRVTLPLAVFFRFHSAVVFIELFKEVFSVQHQEPEAHCHLEDNSRRPNNNNNNCSNVAMANSRM